jgi:hypothetical protein
VVHQAYSRIAQDTVFPISPVEILWAIIGVEILVRCGPGVFGNITVQLAATIHFVPFP